MLHHSLFCFDTRILNATLHIYLGKTCGKRNENVRRHYKRRTLLASRTDWSPRPAPDQPKMASDLAYWYKAVGVTGEQLHEAIRVHSTHVGKVCAALHTHKPR